MPLFEHYCENSDCPDAGRIEEHYFSQASAPEPDCAVCGRKTVRVMSAFSSPFMGLMTTRYNDPKREGAHMEGHWAYRRNTLSGNTEPVYLETFQQRREFMKSEGLVGCEDVAAALPDANGKRVSSVGMPGCHV